MENLKIKIKRYAVIWKESSKSDFDIPTGEEILYAEPDDEKNMIFPAPCKKALAIFTNKKDADEFRDGNDSWKVVPVKIEY